MGNRASTPTFCVTFANRRLVVRKRPAGPVLPSAHAIDREHRVMGALAGSGVLVPEMVLYHDEPDVIDTAFFVMKRLEGRVFANCFLPDVLSANRTEMFFLMASTLARLHQVD